MRVVVLSHRIPYPPNKGEKIRTFHQLEYLHQQGVELTVLSLQHDCADQRLALQYEQDRAITVISERAGLKKLRMLAGLFIGRSFSVSHFYCAALQKRFDQIMAQNNTDAILCTSSAMAQYVFNSQYSPSGTAVRVMDFMDLDSDKWAQYQTMSWFPKSLIYWYEAHAVSKFEQRIQREFDACAFISSNEVELFCAQLQRAARNVHVVGNGVDTSAFHPAERSTSVDAGLQPISLLFSGVMDYFPNEIAMQWFVEHVWDQLRDVQPSIKLVIAGMNPGKKVLAMKDDPNITVTGFVDDMLPYFHAADIFIAPFQMARGVQNKVLQAFACGLPVVASPSGAEGICCVNGESISIAEDAAEFSAAIVELIDNPERYAAQRDAGLSLVQQRYSWEAMNSRLHQLLQGTHID